MSVPLLHENNRTAIERMLGIPMKLKAIPPEVVERVLKAQKCMSRVSLSESLPEHTLLLLCYDFEMVPKAVPTKYGHLRDGETIYFKVNEYEWQPCQYLGVCDPQMHTYHIHIWGENRTAPENMLRESHPGDVAVEAELQKPDIGVQKAVASDTETEEDRDEELAAQRLLDLSDRLKEAWPKTSAVDCAIPAEPFFQGTVIGHGTGKYAGQLQVRPLKETGKGYRWVSAEHISKTAEVVGA